MLGNLVGNAIKFTDAAASSLSVARGLSFTVTDQGVGISAEDRARLFSPFTQAGERRAGAPGSGW